MNDVEKNRALTTADIAGAKQPTDVKPGPGPAPRKEYVEEPRPKKTAPAPKAAEAKAPAGESHPLFSKEEIQRFRSEWDGIQIGFVDQPRQSVEKADGLVAGVIQRLAQIFAEERAKLESQWDRGEDVSTEDLRINLQRYRSFFGRLLNV